MRTMSFQTQNDWIACRIGYQVVVDDQANALEVNL
jgi:hypothetical protein